MRRAKSKNFKHRVQALVVFLLSVILISLPFITLNITANANAVYTKQLGDYEVTLPNDFPNDKFEIAFFLRHINNDGSFAYTGVDEVYPVDVFNADGSLNAEFSNNYKFTYSSGEFGTMVYVRIKDIPAGSRVKVKNIEIERTRYWDDAQTSPYWDNYDRSTMTLSIINLVNPLNKVMVDGESPAQLVVGSTVSQNTINKEGSTTTPTASPSPTASPTPVPTPTPTIEPTVKPTPTPTPTPRPPTEVNGKRETDKTFSDLGGKYDLLYFLNNYNAISLNDIEATHIVGPIFAYNQAKGISVTPDVNKLGFLPQSYLAASDYSRGVFSYSGKLGAYDVNLLSSLAEMTNSSLKMNYIFDKTLDTNFLEPYFYTTSTGIYIDEVAIGTDLVDFISLDDGSYFVSPNHSGKQYTYQNDNFVDFERLK